MSRVLITGGAGRLGAAVARRLLSDPAYDVRVSDQRPAPRWMREGCEMHRGDLRVPAQVATATKGCSHVIHLACFGPTVGESASPAGEPGAANGATGRRPRGGGSAANGPPAGAERPHSLLAYEAALHNAVLHAAVERRIERFVYVSSPWVFERAELFPTPEEHLRDCRPPTSARGFARLSGERQCAAALAEHGLQYTICRPFGAYGPLEVEPDAAPAASPAPAGAPPRDLSELIDRALAGERPLALPGPGEQRLTPTHVEDLAAGIVAALASPQAANEDFNLSSEHELTLAELATEAWGAGEATGELELAPAPVGETGPARSSPSAAKARELLGWEARIGLEQGIAATACETTSPDAPGRPASHDGGRQERRRHRRRSIG